VRGEREIGRLSRTDGLCISVECCTEERWNCIFFGLDGWARGGGKVLKGKKVNWSAEAEGPLIFLRKRGQVRWGRGDRGMKTCFALWKGDLEEESSLLHWERRGGVSIGKRENRFLRGKGGGPLYLDHLGGIVSPTRRGGKGEG